MKCKYTNEPFQWITTSDKIRVGQKFIFHTGRMERTWKKTVWQRIELNFSGWNIEKITDRDGITPMREFYSHSFSSDYKVRIVL